MMNSFFGSNSISGKQLKTVIGEFGTVTQIHRNATGHVIGYGGLLYEQLSWLSIRLNFNLEMIPSKDNLLGENNNGTWSGMTGQLQREEVDFACAPFAGIYTRAVLELAAYIVGDGFGIYVKYPKPIMALDGPVNIFSLNVWICLLFSIIGCIGFIQLLTYLAKKYLAQTHLYENITLSNSWLYIFGTLTNHSITNNDPRNGPRSVGVVAFAWLLSTFVFVNIYSSCMASYMSLRFQRPDISTFEELANNLNYRPAAIKGTGAELTFLKMKSGTFSRIGDRFRHCTDDRCSLSSVENIIKSVLEENFVAVLPITIGNFYVEKTMSDHQCLLTLGQETMAFVNMFMGVPKNSPYVMEINKESFWWNSLGLQRYWMNKLMAIPHQCLLQYNNNGESVQFAERVRFKLEQFRLAFIVLFMGYILALIQFIRERFYYYSQQNRL